MRRRKDTFIVVNQPVRRNSEILENSLVQSSSLRSLVLRHLTRATEGIYFSKNAENSTLRSIIKLNSMCAKRVCWERKKERKKGNAWNRSLGVYFLKPIALHDLKRFYYLNNHVESWSARLQLPLIRLDSKRLLESFQNFMDW